MINIDFCHSPHELLEFFKKTDSDYHPPLSERQGGIEDFVRECFIVGGESIVARQEGKIVGTFGYWNIGKSYWLHWLGVLDQFKKTSLPIILFKYALRERPLARNGTAYSRTWKTNKESQNLMERLGARRISYNQVPVVILNTLSLKKIPERETVWYQIEIKKSYEILKC